ncbi:MAG: helix-turn-helix domain-containing protein [Bacteroidota bacterium]
MTFHERLLLMDRMDRMIRLKATGTPQTFAEKMGISRTTIYRAIEDLKDFGAPVTYCRRTESFMYTDSFQLDFNRIRY